MSFRVDLDNFNGPLDLLLYLVRKEELDIRELPIARITESFLDYLEILQLIDFEIVGDFVVMASSLLEIKSRLVLPQQEAEPAQELVEVSGDPRGDLIRQLLDYKRFRDAAKLLEEHSAKWQERFPRLSNDHPETGSDPATDRIKEVELWDLVSAFSRILRHNATVPQTNIVYDETPISVYVERLKHRVAQEGQVAFSSFFEGTRLKSKIVGIFLAILELLRHHHYRAEQAEDFGEIWVFPPSENWLAPNADKEPSHADHDLDSGLSSDLTSDLVGADAAISALALAGEEAD